MKFGAISLCRGQSARELTSALWGHELANALRVLRGTLPQDGGRPGQKSPTLTLCMKLRNALSEVWANRGNDVFDVG